MCTDCAMQMRMYTTNKQTSVLKNQRLWMKNTCPLLGYLTVTWASPFLDTDYSEP